MASSSAKYAQAEGDVERPMKAAVDTSRKCVRSIRQCALLSQDWISLVQALKQLTGFVQLEGRMPANTKVSETQGRNKDSSGTLWDQEVSENAIRILVEEAKLNLCLRMINDFKQWQFPGPTRARDLEEAAAKLSAGDLKYTPEQVDKKCSEFEEAMSFLLWRSLTHVEVLQLMDVPLLLEHIHLVLASALQRRDEAYAPGAKTQEMAVVHYYASLMKHAEKLNNGELLAKMQELRLVSLMTQHVLAFGRACDAAVLLSVAEGFAALADNEDFGASWEGYFADADEKAAFLQLEELVVAPVIREAPEKKRDLRPLLDFFKTLQRSCR